MSDEILPIDPTRVNYVHCITRNNRAIYRQCIEDPNGKQLTEWVELSKDNFDLALRNSLVVPTKIDDKGDREEDCRLQILLEGILRARLYPKT